MKDKKTYHKELGFKLPDNYFENLEDQLMDHVSLTSELSDDAGFKTPGGYFDTLTDELVVHASLKDAIGDDHAFTVPDGYFESLSSELLPDDTNLTKEVTVKKLNWWYPALAVAAGLAVLFSLNITGSPSDDVDFAQLETTEIEAFFAYQSDDDQDHSLELLYATQPDLLEDISIHTEFSEDELYNYLLEDIDLNEIIIE